MIVRKCRIDGGHGINANCRKQWRMHCLMVAVSELLARDTPIRMVSRGKACVGKGKTWPERPRYGRGRIRYDRIHCAMHRYTDRTSGSPASVAPASESSFIESRV